MGQQRVTPYVILSGSSDWVPYRFSVVVTARSSEKGDAIIKSLDPNLRSHVSWEVVPDISEDGAFDHVSYMLFKKITILQTLTGQAGLSIRAEIRLRDSYSLAL